jgi:predicted nucleic acid-binding protein
VKFWDSSAVVPLLFEEKQTKLLRELAEDDRDVHVWWATELECLSAIGRRERQGAPADRIQVAIRQLGLLASRWNEVIPASAVREIARRLLRVHVIRAADALQLAAALVLAEDNTASIEFLCLDDRLRDAASREGFRILP